MDYSKALLSVSVLLGCVSVFTSEPKKRFVRKQACCAYKKKCKPSSEVIIATKALEQAGYAQPAIDQMRKPDMSKVVNITGGEDSFYAGDLGKIHITAYRSQIKGEYVTDVRISLRVGKKQDPVSLPVFQKYASEYFEYMKNAYEAQQQEKLRGS